MRGNDFPGTAAARDAIRPGMGDASDAPATASSRRLVGVVRVLRGRLAAPCRCCSDAAAAHHRHDDEERR